MVKKRGDDRKVSSKSKVSSTQSTLRRVSHLLSVVALLLNVLILPGLGSLVGLKFKSGIAQIILYLIAIGLVIGGFFGALLNSSLILLVVAGVILGLLVWLWSLLTSISIIKKG